MAGSTEALRRQRGQFVVNMGPTPRAMSLSAGRSPCGATHRSSHNSQVGALPWTTLDSPRACCRGLERTLMEPTNDQATRQHGTFGPDGGDIPAAVLFAGGGLVFLLGAARRSTLVRAAGLLATLTACGLYARRKLAVRRARIDVAESHIRAELDDLDPVARARALAEIARAGLHGSAERKTIRRPPGRVACGPDVRCQLEPLSVWVVSLG